MVLKGSLVHLVSLTWNKTYSPTANGSSANSLWVSCSFGPKSPRKITVSETSLPSLSKSHHRFTVLLVNRICFANLNLDKVGQCDQITHTEKK